MQLKRLALFIILVVVLAQAVHAFGITPVNANAQFIPDDEFVNSFRVVNDEGVEAFVRVSVDGELKDFVTIADSILEMDEEGVTVAYSMKFPRDAPDPGQHTIRIYVEPITKADKEVFGAHVRLAHKIVVNVPAHGSFATIVLEIEEDDTRVELIANVRNIGTEDISEMSATFDVVEPGSGESVVSAKTPVRNLRAGAREQLSMAFSSDKVTAGMYEIGVVLEYDEQIAEVSRAWQRGVPSIELLNSPTFVKASDVTPFDLTLKSNWNQPLNNVFAEVIVLNDIGQPLRTFRTETFDIAPYEVRTLSTFFDTRGLTKDKVPVKVKFHLGGQQVQEYTFSVEVVAPEVYTQRIATPTSLFSSSKGVRDAILVGFVIVAAIAALAGLWHLLYKPKPPAPASPEQAVRAFVRSSLRLGYSLPEIRQKLLEEGWSEKVVDRVLESYRRK